MCMRTGAKNGIGANTKNVSRAVIKMRNAKQVHSLYTSARYYFGSQAITVEMGRES